jgi:hypothetical protein
MLDQSLVTEPIGNTNASITALNAHIADNTMHTVDGLALADPEVIGRIIARANTFKMTTSNGWTAVVTGSGGTGQFIMYMYAVTGVTPNSSGMLHTNTNMFGLNLATAAATYINFAKKLRLSLLLQTDGDDAEKVAYFQLKQAHTIADLAAPGLGIKIVNGALYGESYGSARGVVDLGTTLTRQKCYRVDIVHTPGSKIEWYVNNVLAGTQSTAANIPNAVTAGDGDFVLGIANGPTGGVANRVFVGQIHAWQAE